MYKLIVDIPRSCPALRPLQSFAFFVRRGNVQSLSVTEAQERVQTCFDRALVAAASESKIEQMSKQQFEVNTEVNMIIIITSRQHK